jgi:hypothetical protein
MLKATDLLSIKFFHMPVTYFEIVSMRMYSWIEVRKESFPLLNPFSITETSGRKQFTLERRNKYI